MTTQGTPTQGTSTQGTSTQGTSTQGTSSDPGPVDDAAVAQTAGEGTGLRQSRPAGGGHEREVGVTAAVERGPAELSDEGDPVHEDEHASVTGEEPARSTDEL